MSSPKNDLKRDFAADVYLSEAPSPNGFCFGWCSNFGGSESGQILKGNGKGEGVEPEIRLEGQQFTMLFRKYQHD
jgi:hypothetical protein